MKSLRCSKICIIRDKVIVVNKRVTLLNSFVMNGTLKNLSCFIFFDALSTSKLKKQKMLCDVERFDNGQTTSVNVTLLRKDTVSFYEKNC